MSRSRVSTTCRTRARSARADRLRARGSTWLVVPLCLVLLAGCGRGSEVPPPQPQGSDAVAAETSQARTVLARLGEELGRAADDEGALDALTSLAAAGGEQLLGEVGENVRSLDVVDVETRFLEREGPLDAEEREQYGEDAWAARMQLGYAYDGLDPRPVRVESRVVLGPRAGAPGEVGVLGFGGGSGTRTPLWLVGPLSVAREGDDLVAVAGSGTGRYPGLVERARSQVRQVLPGWDGPLVVEVPRDAAQMEAALAAPPGEYDAIAGVAAAADAEPGRGAPTRVYLNPEVFGGLSPTGAQLVMTHEATHVAVDASSARMPVWLLEGFADHVALLDDRVPVEVAARQVLDRIREEGLPDGLPTSADLEPTALDLGATYEEAWLACRYLARTYGEDAMVSFYEEVDGGTSTDRAFAEVLGTSERGFVRGWRADLADLAGLPGRAG